MKKVLLVVLILLIILGGVFYKQILATVDFYQYQQDNVATFTKATINWKEIPFTSTGRYAVGGESLAFQTLQLPIPFPATIKEGADTSFALGGAQSISVARNSAAADFFDDNEFSPTDKKTACSFLSQTSGRGACTSNYNLYHAFLELNKTDIHAFASTEDKALYNRLMIIRAESIPGNTISGFETSHLKGFLFTIDSGNYIAHLFDKQDQMYEVKFTNLEQSDVAFVLSNLSHTER